MVKYFRHREKDTVPSCGTASADGLVVWERLGVHVVAGPD